MLNERCVVRIGVERSCTVKRGGRHLRHDLLCFDVVGDISLKRYQSNNCALVRVFI